MAICPACGTKLPPHAAYCHVCGHGLVGGTAPFGVGIPFQPGQAACDDYLVTNLLAAQEAHWIFAAKHRFTGREVLVVLVQPSSGAERHALLREARRLSNLKHPNIPVLYAFREESHGLVAVFDRPRGRRLATLLQGRGRGILWALALADQLLDGLAHAHAQGLVHGRLSPHVLWLDERDRLTITGFGALQTFFPPPSGPDRAAFLAPELAVGQSATPATDVYCAGLVLYASLAGHPPFQSESEYEILRQQVETPPPDLHGLSPTVPPRIASCVARALVKDPAGRFQDAREFLQALRKAQRDSIAERVFVEASRQTQPTALPMAHQDVQPPRPVVGRSGTPTAPPAPPSTAAQSQVESPEPTRSTGRQAPEKQPPHEVGHQEEPDRAQREEPRPPSDREAVLPALTGTGDSGFDLAEVGLGSRRRLGLLVLLVVTAILAAAAAFWWYGGRENEHPVETAPAEPSPAHQALDAGPEDAEPSAETPRPVPRPRPSLPAEVATELPKLAKARSTKAAKRLEDLLRKYPWSRDVRKAAARYYEAAAWRALNDGMYRRTLRAARRATQLDPDTRLAWFCLGYALRETGKRQEARAAFQRYVELCADGQCRLLGLAKRYAKR